LKLIKIGKTRETQIAERGEKEDAGYSDQRQEHESSSPLLKAQKWAPAKNDVPFGGEGHIVEADQREGRRRGVSTRVSASAFLFSITRTRPEGGGTRQSTEED